MNCREFRRNHDAYIDDTLRGVDLDRMTAHRSLCAACAQLDTRVRRALLVAHNLPQIHPSAAFHARLQARLADERRAQRPAQLHGSTVYGDGARQLSVGPYVALAAGLLVVAGLVGAVTLEASREQAIRLNPVVATRPAPVLAPPGLAMPTTMAFAPTGIPLWPAVFVPQPALWHLASDASGSSETFGH